MTTPEEQMIPESHPASRPTQSKFSNPTKLTLSSEPPTDLNNITWISYAGRRVGDICPRCSAEALLLTNSSQYQMILGQRHLYCPKCKFWESTIPHDNIELGSKMQKNNPPPNASVPARSEPPFVYVSPDGLAAGVTAPVPNVTPPSATSTPVSAALDAAAYHDPGPGYVRVVQEDGVSHLTAIDPTEADGLNIAISSIDRLNNFYACDACTMPFKFKGADHPPSNAGLCDVCYALSFEHDAFDAPKLAANPNPKTHTTDPEVWNSMGNCPACLKVVQFMATAEAPDTPFCSDCAPTAPKSWIATGNCPVCDKAMEFIATEKKHQPRVCFHCKATMSLADNLFGKSQGLKGSTIVDEFVFNSTVETHPTGAVRSTDPKVWNATDNCPVCHEVVHFIATTEEDEPPLCSDCADTMKLAASMTEILANRKAMRTPVETHPTGAVRSTDTNGFAFDLLSPIPTLCAAGVMAEGADKYSRGNYLKGFTISCLYQHLMMHLQLFLLNDQSENHLGHAQWNLNAMIHFMATRPELDDRIKYDLTTEDIERIKQMFQYKGSKSCESSPLPASSPSASSPS